LECGDSSPLSQSDLLPHRAACRNNSSGRLGAQPRIGLRNSWQQAAGLCQYEITKAATSRRTPNGLPHFSFGIEAYNCFQACRGISGSKLPVWGSIGLLKAATSRRTPKAPSAP
jgi:hypothetical protein